MLLIKKPMIAIAMSLGLAMTMSSAAYADKPADKPMQKPGKEFFKKLDHVSFMPNLMKYIKQNRKALEIKPEQMAELNKYHQQNSPKVRSMVEKIIELENKAKNLALDNFPPEKVEKIGSESIKLRHDLMLAKIQCRSFVKSVLTPEQYKKALTSYN